MTISVYLAIPGAVLAIATVIGLAYAGWRRITNEANQTAYERLRGETILAEAQETISQKDQELAAVHTSLSKVEEQAAWYRTREVPRLQRKVDDQVRTIALQAETILRMERERVRS